MESSFDDDNGFSGTRFSMDEFHLMLREFDKSVCEANAVSQGVGVRQAEAYMGWSTHIFMRMCVHASIMIANVPKSRWAKKDYEFWDFSLVASHARALMEAELLFMYLSDKPNSQQEWSAKLNVMHMNDCMKRIEIVSEEESSESMQFYLGQKEEITKRLMDNCFFMSLDSGTRKRCLSGKAMHIPSRDELLTALGKDVREFKLLFDFLSHYTHILPMSFYRVEPNGRGTGCFNETDLGYISMAMMVCQEILINCTTRMIELFPDVAKKRKGLKSAFTLGPKPRK